MKTLSKSKKILKLAVISVIVIILSLFVFSGVSADWQRLREVGSIDFNFNGIAKTFVVYDEVEHVNCYITIRAEAVSNFCMKAK